MDNNKIKEAFEKWADAHDFNIKPDKVVPSIYHTPATNAAWDGYNAGYTSRDAEIEQLKKDKQELLEVLRMTIDIMTTFTYERDEDSFSHSYFKARLPEDGFFIPLNEGIKLIERMKG